MPPYEAPKSGASYDCKFVRIGEDIIVTQPDDLETQHNALVAEEDLTIKLLAKKREAPIEVDAGQMHVHGKKIVLGYNSGGLDLPVQEFWSQARQRSVEVFQQKSPDHTVSAQRD